MKWNFLSNERKNKRNFFKTGQTTSILPTRMIPLGPGSWRTPIRTLTTLDNPYIIIIREMRSKKIKVYEA